MNRVLRMACLGFGLLLAGPVQAQLLWPGTAAGMTVEEVRKVFPEAHAPDNPLELPMGRGTELLALDGTVIANHPFKAGFFFKEERLVHVALQDTGEIPMKEFEKFRDLLRTKYGLEYSTESSDSLQIKWKAVQTVILLTWSPRGHGIVTLSITYEAPIPKETERL